MKRSRNAETRRAPACRPCRSRSGPPDREHAPAADGARAVPEVQAGGPACDQLFADLLTEFPLYANLGVIGLDGMVTCSGIPTAGPVYLGDRTYFQRAVADPDLRGRRVPDRPHHWETGAE